MTTRGKETQWRGYAPSLTGWTVTVDAGVHQIVADNGNWVCECMPQAAPLIAAAPDMLDLLRWLDRKGGIGHVVHRRITATIAQAEGKTPALQTAQSESEA